MAGFYSFNDGFSLGNNIGGSVLSSGGADIECSKCSVSPKYMRCKCCNKTITLTDFLTNVEKTHGIIKFVKIGTETCIKLNVKHIYNITKYFIPNSEIFTTAVNFNYNVNYIENKTNDGQIIKGIRNIEMTEILSNFKQEGINIKHLIMCNNLLDEALILINIKNLNVAN